MKKLLSVLLCICILTLGIPIFLQPAYGADSTPVTIIGDSVTAHSIPDIKKLLPNADIDATVGRTWAQGILALQNSNATGKLKSTVVIELGAVGPVSSSDVEEMLHIASGKKVIFVTVFGLNNDVPWMASTNRTLQQEAAAHSDVNIADWYALASQHPDWIDSNSTPAVNPKSPTGTGQFAKLIQQTISPSQTGPGGSNKGSGSSKGQKPVIVLDPGHSGKDIQSIDPQTGLIDHDYPNIPEITEVFTIAQDVKKQLEADGYTVILTKNSVNDSVSLRKRADIANQAHADLAVSIHDDHSQSWNNFAQIYVQKVGLHRDTSSGKQVQFTDSAVASLSQSYGRIFQQERQAQEKHTVTVTDDNFSNRAGISPGNIPLVELFANVPWVYNEVGASGVLTTKEEDSYTQGLINAIEKAVPSGTNSGSGLVGNGNATASCVITKVGNPKDPEPPLPPECQTTEDGGNAPNNDIMKWVKQISKDLQISQIFNYYNYYNPSNPATNGKYTAEIRTAQNTGTTSTGIYWCTTLVIDSYRLAGYPHPDPADDVFAVDNMVSRWRGDYGPAFNFLDYSGSTTADVPTKNDQSVIQQVKAGDAIMFHTPGNGDQHVAIVSDISFDKHGNGDIYTYDANGPVKTNKYPIANWHIHVTWGDSNGSAFVIGFGQVQ